MIKSKPHSDKSSTKVIQEHPKIAPSTSTSSKLAYKDPFIEKEDAEIARLEKLLGIKKGIYD